MTENSSPGFDEGPPPTTPQASSPQGGAQQGPAQGAAQGAPYTPPTGGPQGYPPPAYIPPAPMLETEARTISMLIHILSAVAAVISAGLLGFVVPLVMWLIYRERSALVDHHGRLNLNLQLTALTVVVGGVVLGVMTAFLGFFLTGPLMLAYFVYAVVMAIVTGVRANRGEYGTIPLVIHYLR